MRREGGGGDCPIDTDDISKSKLFMRMGYGIIYQHYIYRYIYLQVGTENINAYRCQKDDDIYGSVICHLR